MIESTQNETNSDTVYIPLGCRCSTAFILRDNLKVRETSLPFDWINIPLPNIAKFIDLPKGTSIEVFCKQYFDEVKAQVHTDGTWFPHDYILTDLSRESDETVLARYTRRVERLHSLLSSSKRLVFLTTASHFDAENIQHYNHLRDVIKKRDANSYFVSVNVFPEDTVIETHHNGYNFYLEKEPNGDHEFKRWEATIAQKINENQFTKEYFTKANEDIKLPKRVLVTGGSGLVGKALQRAIPFASFVHSAHYNLLNQNEVEAMVERYKPEVIIHCAAVVSGIQDNIERPYTHFTDNVLMNTLLIDAARRHGVKNFIGVLSTCVYPDKVSEYPMEIDQLHESAPTPTNFSYGYAKRAMAVQIEACNEQYGTNYCYVIPSNIYGIDDKFDDKRSHFVGALIKKIKACVDSESKEIELYGTGRPLRQFVLSDSVAEAIALMVNNDVYENVNICGDKEYSIDQIAKIALKAIGRSDIKIKYKKGTPDGQYRKTASNAKFKKLFPKFKFIPLAEGLRQTYEHFKNR